jgi:hypothetical protein
MVACSTFSIVHWSTYLDEGRAYLPKRWAGLHRTGRLVCLPEWWSDLPTWMEGGSIYLNGGLAYILLVGWFARLNGGLIYLPIWWAGLSTSTSGLVFLLI